MKYQYTEGPWVIHEGATHSEWTALSIRPSYHGNRSIPAIAKIEKQGRVNYEANAHLISAAPELLDALQGVLSVFCPEEEWKGTAVYEQAMAAINKALGE